MRGFPKGETHNLWIMWITLNKKKNGVNFPAGQVNDLSPVSVPILSFVAKNHLEL